MRSVGCSRCSTSSGMSNLSLAGQSAAGTPACTTAGTRRGERAHDRQGLFGELETPFYLAVVQLEHAEWLVARDRASEAEPLVAEALQTFERLEAGPWVARAAQALTPERHAQAVT